MFRILLVEDNNEMRGALKSTLTLAGYAVTEAEHGRIAQNKLKLEEFDLVISDFQMAHMNGIELLKWIKENKNLPVILITGFSQLLETQTASSLGASGFLTKPFSYKEVLKVIQKVMAPDSSVTKIEDTDLSFCAIPIEDFVSGSGMQIGIYIKLGPKKYIRIAHQGDEVPNDKVEAYKEKGVHFLYAKKDDFGRFIGFNLNLSKILKDDDQVSAEKKTRFMRYTTGLILENTAVKGINKNAFDQASNSLNSYMSLITDSSDLFQVLQALNGENDRLYSHSLAVSIYSVMLAKQLGWKSQPNLFKLTTAGLFHDIGEKEIDSEITAKKFDSLTLDEKKKFEAHCDRGRAMLLELTDIPADVVQIVHEHHECYSGRGYPRQLKKESIHPLARVIAVADKFCNYALKSSRSSGCDAETAFRHVEESHKDEIDPEILEALRAMCQPAPTNLNV